MNRYIVRQMFISSVAELQRELDEQALRLREKVVQFEQRAQELLLNANDRE